MLTRVTRVLVTATALNCLAPYVARAAQLTTPELIEAYGYPSEIHTVQTQDGYLLTMHRIPHGLRTKTIGKPAYVAHGLALSSANFLLTGPENALPYILADKGYDVWLPNFRGNPYSLKHEKYSTTSKEFWDFSWHEIGMYDQPALIDYVLATTNSTQLYYVGHSQGTTTFYVLMSSLPEYNTKIKVACHLSPVAFMNHLYNPFARAASRIHRFIEIAANILHIYTVYQTNTTLSNALSELCPYHPITEIYCTLPIFLAAGFDQEQLNKTQLPIIRSHFQERVSIKQFLHYLQEIVSGHFRQYDYGKSRNMKVYGTPEPPDYNISQITAPVAMFYSDNDWLNSPIPELIEVYGYPSETHTVQTEDGYILTMHRIPHGLRNKTIGKPAMVVHGLALSSVNFLVSGPENALPYFLADEGYDVWLPNARGNTYSQKHAKYSTTSKEFWNFSMHEIGMYDLPALIDYVLATTNSSQLSYVGHSQGSAILYVLTSSLPEYNTKIKVACLLSPVAFLNHLYNPFLRAMAWIHPLLEIAANVLHIYSVLPGNTTLIHALSELCPYHPFTEIFCALPLFLAAGFDQEQLNKTQLPIIWSHQPAGASVKQFMHYFQEINSGHFRQYDYGKSRNIKVYGTPEPPDYNTSQITAPIAIFYGDNDWLNSPIDIKRLHDAISNPIKYIRVPFEKWNHLDFLWGIDARSLVYERILEIFAEYE